MKAISEDSYLEAVDAMEGWCVNCQDFTRDMVEPDAANYCCPICDKMTVHGAEDSLISGFFTIGGDDDQGGDETAHYRCMG